MSIIEINKSNSNQEPEVEYRQPLTLEELNNRLAGKDEDGNIISSDLIGRQVCVVLQRRRDNGEIALDVTEGTCLGFQPLGSDPNTKGSSLHLFEEEDDKTITKRIPTGFIVDIHPA